MDDDTPAGRAQCIRWLARREHSATELRRKLTARGFRDEQATAVVSELREAGWQSDARFAESFIRHRIEQGYGPARIRFELAQRGITNADLDGLAAAEGGWLAVAARAYRKRYGETAPGGRAEQDRRARWLAQRGFAYEDIHALLRRLAAGETFDDGI